MISFMFLHIKCSVTDDEMKKIWLFYFNYGIYKATFILLN